MGLDMYIVGTDRPAPSKDSLWEAASIHSGRETEEGTSWYWRKASTIHCALLAAEQLDPDIDADWIEISARALRALRSDLWDVLEDPKELGPELLPIYDAFMGGCTDYGRDYVELMRETFRHVTEALMLLDKRPGTRFYYMASW